MQAGSVSPRWLKIILGLGSAAFLAALASFAYSGLFSRYMADDYCTPLYTRFYGFWHGEVAAYQIATGRFVSTFLISLFEFLGPRAYPWMPALVIVLWTVGMAWFFLSIRRYLPFHLATTAAWLLGMLVVLSTIIGAPSRLQSLYWRDGMFNYGAPLVVLPFLLVIFANTLAQPQSVLRLIFASLGSAVLALAAGGMSESFITIEVALFLMVAAYALVIWRGWRRSQALWLMGSSLVGALVALIVTWFSPATHNRQAYFPPAPDLLTLVKLSLRYGYIFMRTYTDKMKLLTIMTAGIPALLAFYLSPKGLPGKSWHWLLALVLIPLAGYLLLVAVCAPSAYGETSYPEARVLMIARFSLVCTMLIFGAAGGMALRRWLDGLKIAAPAWFNPAALALLALLSLYAVVVSWQINSKEIPARQAWAAVWDQRDAQLRYAAAHGQTSVQVVALDSWETIYELGADPKLWVNTCAAQFYGLKSITAVTP